MDDKTRIEELERQLAILQPIIELEKERVREEESQQARVAAWKLVTDQFTPFVENKNIHGVPHFFGCTLNGVNDGNRTIVSFRAFRTTIMGDREYINIYVMANTAEEAMNDAVKQLGHFVSGTTRANGHVIDGRVVSFESETRDREDRARAAAATEGSKCVVQ